MTNLSILLKLISLLADGAFHSRKQIRATLDISQADINQYVQTMRYWGLNVVTVPGKGYYLLHGPLQLLNEEAICPRELTGRLTVLPIINSTNQYLIERLGYVQPGDACVAEYQTQGRGRRGRHWVSSFGNNLYLSIYWRLQHGPAAIGLSLMVSIVIAEFIQRLGAEKVRIKWPNDLYLENRKLAGILVEVFGKTGDFAHVVIGVGLNLMMHEFVATRSIINQGWINLQEAGIAIDRNALVTELTDELRQKLQQFDCDGFAPFDSRWPALDNFLNQPVKLLISEREITGIARGIDAHGALLLEQQGEISAYLGGEISLRSL